jgi:hypothetical protein
MVHIFSFCTRNLAHITVDIQFSLDRSSVSGLRGFTLRPGSVSVYGRGSSDIIGARFEMVLAALGVSDQGLGVSMDAPSHCISAYNIVFSCQRGQMEIEKFRQDSASIILV